MLSLPILMTSEISSKLPAKFLGAELVGNPQLGVMKPCSMVSGLFSLMKVGGNSIRKE